MPASSAQLAGLGPGRTGATVPKLLVLRCWLAGDFNKSRHWQLEVGGAGAWQQLKAMPCDIGQGPAQWPGLPAQLLALGCRVLAMFQVEANFLLLVCWSLVLGTLMSLSEVTA